MRTDDQAWEDNVSCPVELMLLDPTVLPYLITVADDEIESDSEADSNAFSDDKSNNWAAIFTILYLQEGLGNEMAKCLWSQNVNS